MMARGDVSRVELKEGLLWIPHDGAGLESMTKEKSRTVIAIRSRKSIKIVVSLDHSRRKRRYPRSDPPVRGVGKMKDGPKELRIL
jgi:hypothetical protein